MTDAIFYPPTEITDYWGYVKSVNNENIITETVEELNNVFCSIILDRLVRSVAGLLVTGACYTVFNGRVDTKPQHISNYFVFLST